MATEIVRTLVGSIGLVASVPLTWMAALVVAGARTRRFEEGFTTGEAGGADV